MMLVLIFLPILMAFLLLILSKKNEKAAYITALLTTFAELVLAVLLFTGTLSPAADIRIPVVLSYGLYFTLDNFRKVYTLIIAFMWFMTMLLSREYFHGHGNTVRYFFFNLMTEGAILGVFLSGDLYTTLVFFEVMSFTSFVWVIQEETEGAIRAANTYLAIAVIGGLSALMGIFLLENRLGTTEIAALYEAAEGVENKGVLYAAGVCILVGFGAKAGMFPLHIWLPKAHPVAPAPASALLSGVLTKSGIFGILAISMNIFREDAAWGTLILVLGVITMFLGALLALLSIDLKRTLACSSMSQIGFILIGTACTCLLKEEGGLAAGGTILHMVNHSLLKLVLFMCAGCVYMNLHELDLNRIRGFGRDKTVLKICFLLGAVGIGGIPGFNGYISKTLLHEGILEAHHLYGWTLKAVEWIFLASGGLTLAYMTKLFVAVFLEKPDSEAEAFQQEMRQKHPRYLGVFGHIALIGSAVFMPLLGLTGNSLMRTIANQTAPFFRSEGIHAVSYFSLENLKGAGISLAVGAAVYFLVVRKLLMKNGRYVNVLPAWMDLEDSIYRPVLLKFLPFVFGKIAALFGENKLSSLLAKGVMKASGFLASLFGENKITAPLSKGFTRLSGIISRCFSDSLDAIILLLRKTILSPVLPPDSENAAESIPYRLGNGLDWINRKKGKEKASEHRFAESFYRFFRTLTVTVHNLTDSVSFPLLAMVAGIVGILLYVLILHRLR